MNSPGMLLNVEATSPMVHSLTSDAMLLGVWGFLRLATRPMTLAAIAEATHLDGALLQRKLDVLGTYGIVEALPATARRRATAYRALFTGMQICVQRSGHHHVLRAIASNIQAHARSLVPETFVAPGPNESRGWHADFTGVFNLMPEEAEELRRRLNRVVEYTTMLGEKFAARGQSPELCNYVLTFRASPLQVPALPIAPVRVVLAGVNDQPPDVGTGKKRTEKLSTREREVAIGLARGRTAKEVGQMLGIKRSSVATMTKRIYKKLGVHRRAELAARLEEVIGGSMPPDTHALDTTD